MDAYADFPVKYRIQRASPAEDLPKGYVEQFSALTEKDRSLVFEFLLSDKWMGGETTVREKGQEIFSIGEAKGIGGMSWEVAGINGEMGSFKAPNLTERNWRGQIASGAEFQMFDATKLKDQVFRDMLNGWPDSYQLIETEQIVGYISRQQRQPRRSKGLFGKVKNLFSDFDWVLSLRRPLERNDLVTALCLSIGTIKITVPADRS